MSSGVETSRIVTFKAVPRDSSTALGTTIFAVLDTYHDHAPHSAAMNMAIDEALLEVVRVPSVRFYQWGSPALSFGYFGKFADVANYAGERDLVRRWTGGGVVFHGDDLTYAIVIPSNDPVFGESSRSIYVTIHAALRDALIANGEPAQLAPATGVIDAAAAIIDRGYNCFANPVRTDVMIDGRKVAGAAQRRTRRGLLQQGSIQGVDLAKNFADQFANELCLDCYRKTLDDNVISRAHEIAEQKYAAASWLQRR